MDVDVDISNVLVALVLAAATLSLGLAARGAAPSSRAHGLLPVRTVMYALAYATVSVLGRSLVLPESNLALFWPAAGVAALWLVNSPRGLRVQLDVVVLFSVTLLVNEALGISLGPALLFAAANLVVTAAFWLGVRTIDRYRSTHDTRRAAALVAHAGSRRSDQAADQDHDVADRPVLLDVRDLAGVGAASLAAGLLSMPFGATAAYLLTGAAHPGLMVAWVLRNTTGVFLVVVAGMVAAQSRSADRRHNGWRAFLAPRARPHVAAEAVCTVTTALIFTAWVFASGQHLPLSFLTLMAAGVVGSRFSPLVGVLYTGGVAAIAVSTTLRQEGPFGGVLDPLTRANVVQLFLLATASVVLTYSLAAREREHMRRQLEAAEASSREQAELLTGVARDLSDGLVVLEEDGTVLVENAAARAWLPDGMTGVDRAPDLEELSIFGSDGAALAPDQAPHVRCLVEDQVIAVDLVRRDTHTGAERIMRVIADPITLTSSGTPRRLAVLRLLDVTESTARQRNLEAFAGIVAHDLRAPLAAMTGWNEMAHDELSTYLAAATVAAPDHSLTDPPVGGIPTGDAPTGFVLAKHLGLLETAKAHLERGQATSAQMTGLVADLLRYATTSSGEMHPVPITLEGAVAEVATLVTAAVPDGALAPLIDVCAPDVVTADPGQLRQLLTNLLGNAAKYVAAGTTPYIQVRSRPRADAMVEIDIIDNGIGIPAEARARVFGSFYRAHRNQGYPGTGLGLAICEAAVHRHGGTISAHPAPTGTGTLITLTLPSHQHEGGVA